MLAKIEEGQEDGEMAPAERDHMLTPSEQMEVMVDTLPERDCAFNACGRHWFVIHSVILSFDHLKTSFFLLGMYEIVYLLVTREVLRNLWGS